MSRVNLGSALLSENEIRQIGDGGIDVDQPLSCSHVLAVWPVQIVNRGGNTPRVRLCQQHLGTLTSGALRGQTRVGRPLIPPKGFAYLIRWVFTAAARTD
jgi:hypothetical protein